MTGTLFVKKLLWFYLKTGMAWLSLDGSVGGALNSIFHVTERIFGLQIIWVYWHLVVLPACSFKCALSLSAVENAPFEKHFGIRRCCCDRWQICQAPL